MKKASLLGVSIGSALLVGVFSLAPFASVAHAQVVYTDYSNPAYVSGYAGICVELTAPMTIGSTDALTGGQVSSLQNFLVREGLLPSTDVTGYFGSITASAVAEFQPSHDIAASGVVGPLTRAAIEQASCGTSTISPAHPIYPTNPLYPVNPGGPIQYNNGYPYGYYGAPELNSLSASTASGSLVITLSGYGFDPSDNTVNFGGTTVSDVASNNDSTLTFTVPSTMDPGTYPVTVTTSRGTSNSLTYTVSEPTCGVYNGTYPYEYNNNYSCGCNYNEGSNYNYNNEYNGECPNESYNSITLSSLSETSGSTGSSITAYGSGFTSSNTVDFDGTVISNVYSNGSSLTFTVPYINANYSGETYPVSITNSNGQSSNSIDFTITNYGYTNDYGYNGPLSISSLSPSAGEPGAQIEIEGSGFSTNANTVYFGSGTSESLPSYNNGTVIYFSVPENLNGGSYPIYVNNGSGESSNTVSFDVY